MKISILWFLSILTISCYSQADIEMNPSACTSDSGIIEIISGAGYSNYQWYSKPLNSSVDFAPILGATNETFNFDWLTYNETLIKVECFYDGISYYFSDIVELNLSNCSLGLPGIVEQSKISVFPNPVRDYLKVSNIDELDKIQIFNSFGQNIFNLKDSNIKKIDTTSFASGVYILVAISGNNLKKIKFIKS